MQDGVHLLSDGHFHVARVSEPDGSGGGEDPFGDHAVHPGDDFGKLFPAAEFHAHAAIPRKAARTSENKIAQTREPSHCV